LTGVEHTDLKLQVAEEVVLGLDEDEIGICFFEILIELEQHDESQLSLLASIIGIAIFLFCLGSEFYD